MNNPMDTPKVESFVIPTIDIEATGSNLRKLFKAHGYSVSDIQDLLCIGSNQAIYSWLNGRNLPALENIVALSHLLGVAIEELIILE